VMPGLDRSAMSNADFSSSMDSATRLEDDGDGSAEPYRRWSWNTFSHFEKRIIQQVYNLKWKLTKPMLVCTISNQFYL
jgi:hypothetical protein